MSAPRCPTRSSPTRRSSTAWTRATSGSSGAPASASATGSTARSSLADLAAEACAAALDDAHRDAAAVDRVIVSTITPDRLTPGLAPEVAALRRRPRGGRVDINAACAGFLAALEQAAALVESGRADVVLVCGAEALSRITDTEDRVDRHPLRRRRRRRGRRPRASSSCGCAAFELGSDGVHGDLLYADARRAAAAHGGPRGLPPRRPPDGRGDAGRARAGAGLTPTDLDLFVAHQANARIVEAAADELGLPRERVALNVDRVANTSSASIPLALWRGRARRARCAPATASAWPPSAPGFVWGAGRRVLEGARPCLRLTAAAPW